MPENGTDEKRKAQDIFTLFLQHAGIKNIFSFIHCSAVLQRNFLFSGNAYCVEMFTYI